MSNHALDLTGQKFGMLTAVSIVTRTPFILWKCVCECGGEKDVRGTQLKSGDVKSCGCLLRGGKDTWSAHLGKVVNDWTCLEFVSQSKYGNIFSWRHACGEVREILRSSVVSGKAAKCACEPETSRGPKPSGVHVPTRNTHKNMLARCLNQDHVAFHNYGGRGISVDPRWLDYWVFAADMGLRPDGMELDRKDNDGNYCAENCRWVTRTTNLRNTSFNRTFEYKGKRLCVAEIAEIAGINYHMAHTRLTKCGFSVAETIATDKRCERKQNASD